MTKAPRAGRVKTRLAPPLSHAEAAELHACFLRDTAESIMRVSADSGCVGGAIYTPPGSESLFDELLPPRFFLLRQRGADLGERLFSAAADILAAGYASVCLIDSDSPTLPPAALMDAIAALARPGDRVVLGPADDGGYYLIGLKVPHRRLFADIAWSTDRVLAQTIDRTKELHLQTELLPRWYDVDDIPSLRRLCDELLSRGQPRRTPPGYGAPHTRHYLGQLMKAEPERIWDRRVARGHRYP